MSSLLKTTAKITSAEKKIGWIGKNDFENLFLKKIIFNKIFILILSFWKLIQEDHRET